MLNFRFYVLILSFLKYPMSSFGLDTLDDASLSVSETQRPVPFQSNGIASVASWMLIMTTMTKNEGIGYDIVFLVSTVYNVIMGKNIFIHCNTAPRPPHPIMLMKTLEFRNTDLCTAQVAESEYKARSQNKELCALFYTSGPGCFFNKHKL